MSGIALITGVTGQDGAYLARLLLSKGYVVHGTARDPETASLANLAALGIRQHVTLHPAAVSDFRSIYRIIQGVGPNEVYNLAGQSSVGLSFIEPLETLHSIVDGTVNILEAVRLLGEPIRIYSAASGECFGNTDPGGATETTSFNPRSPYGVAKAAAHWTVVNYRESYDLFACSGILFNHESPFRPDRFVTQKIVRGAADIAEGKRDRFELGNLSITRDWGWAPEYVEAMWLMLNRDAPDDFVVATGIASSLEHFVDLAFRQVGLDWRDHVERQESLLRPSDIEYSVGNPEKANRILGWRPQTRMPEVVARLMEAELARRRGDD